MKQFLLDLFFPKRCVGCKKFGDYICADCFSKIEFFSSPACPNCLKFSIDGGAHPKCKTLYSLDGSTASVVYKGIIKRLVYQFKYNPYLSDLKSIIGELCYEGLIQNEAFFSILSEKPLLTCVPLSSKKLRQRGYNHAQLLMKLVASKLGLLYDDTIIYRVRQTKPQFGLKKEDRALNVKNAFAINKDSIERIKGETIFLVDDVATTYATMRECAKVLKRNGAKKVWGVIFAREQSSF